MTRWLACVSLVLAAACAQGGDDDGSNPDARPFADARPRADAAPRADARPSADATVGGGMPRINEFVANHAGSDTNEYVEVIGQANTSYANLTIIVIEGETTSDPGVVTAAVTAGTTNGSGLWKSAFMDNVLQNGAQTLLLVEGWNGTVLTTDVDSANIGTVDNPAWTNIIDGVAIGEGDSADRYYGGVPVLEPDFDGGALSVGGASRIPNGTDTNAIGDWVRNDFSAVPPAGGTVSGMAANTPGAANSVIP